MVAVALLGLGWSGSVVAVLLAAIAFLLYLLVRYQFSPAVSATTDEIEEIAEMAEGKVREDEEEFVVKSLSGGEFVLDLDFQPSHFREEFFFDTIYWKKLYEYRIDEHEVLCRLIESEFEDAGSPKEHDVRDGVVQESEIRARDKYTKFAWKNAEDDIAELKTEVEWQKMEPNVLEGFKYFILSKKLPKPDARRYFRQELERLKIGTARFFKEAEKYGLEPDESSLERFRVADGKSRPSNEEMKRLDDLCPSFGITRLEFESGKKLTALLEKLLSD